MTLLPGLHVAYLGNGLRFVIQYYKFLSCIA